MEWLESLGVPAALVSAGIGLVFWWVKRRLDKQEKEQREREENQKKLFLMMMQSTRANAVGIKAIARAVQRIPDAHCNGDMTKALEVMADHQKEEKEFLLKHGVDHVFDA